MRVKVCLRRNIRIILNWFSLPSALNICRAYIFLIWTRIGKEKNLYKDKTKCGQKRARQVEKLLEKRDLIGKKKDKNYNVTSLNSGYIIMRFSPHLSTC